ncbi:uncharacterized protein [Epargyreus clarus]|uniref:uncharacterized protein n=1 Tax=Epargyreus clarus TaxID=520877 RepID=UPI003C30CA36
MGTVTILLLSLLCTSLVAANCRNKITSTGQCAYRIKCIKNVHGVRLSNECQGSTNYDVTVDLTLEDATDRIDNNTDETFLSIVTTFTAHGHWRQTKLLILENMFRLKHLHLAGNNIERIENSPFEKLHNLETIDLSHNKLYEIENLFRFETYPNKMKKLALSFNALEEIPEDTFSQLTNLIELDLSYNLLTELTQEPFSNLTSLEILRLNNNRIKDLNGAMNNLLNLKQLYVRVNKIQNIDAESIKIINHLETFDISNNELEKLSPIMLSRHWLHLGDHAICRILLSKNHLTHIPNTTFSEMFTRLTRNPLKNPVNVLTEIDLSVNAITHIEYNAFQSVAQLISLDLSWNRLSSFSVNPEDLVYVRFLNLSSNYISSLYYESFSMMTNLQNLDLSRNNFEYVPDQSLGNNIRLTHINMTNNEIASVKGLRITFNSEGGILDLSNNNLSSLNIPTGDALSLSYLILHTNNITNPRLIKLNDLFDLRQLDMSRNYIQELDESSLHLPYALVFLDLSFNEIERIGPSSFHNLNHLRTLRLSHNQLSDIRYGALEGLNDLLNLDLSFNKIGKLDSKVFMDLKFLKVLSLRYNNLFYLEYDTWLAHKFDLIVYLEGNKFSCTWLGTALNNYNNGYSMLRPSVLTPATNGPSIEGIPCDQSLEPLIDSRDSRRMSVDERLLVTSQKILEAVREQTTYLRKNFWRSVQEAEKPIKP